jgi:hypothetical protein
MGKNVFFTNKALLESNMLKKYVMHSKDNENYVIFGFSVANSAAREDEWIGRLMLFRCACSNGLSV